MISVLTYCISTYRYLRKNACIIYQLYISWMLQSRRKFEIHRFLRPPFLWLSTYKIKLYTCYVFFCRLYVLVFMQSEIVSFHPHNSLLFCFLLNYSCLRLSLYMYCTHVMHCRCLHYSVQYVCTWCTVSDYKS